jgi:hypothetical protein
MFECCKAGLLAPGSSERSAFPVVHQWLLLHPSPVTVAGAAPVFNRLPVSLSNESTLQYELKELKST